MRHKKLFLILPIFFFIVSCQSKSSKEKSTTTSLLQLESKNDSLDKNQLKIAYTGNMGVCIEYDKKTVIIDGLHRYYNKAYVFTPETMANELINGTFKDFSAIEFCLVTHMHGDHFSGKYSKQYLESNANGTLIGSAQIKDDAVSFHTKTDSISNKFIVVPYDKKPHTVKKSGITVTAIRCEHTNQKRHGNTQNIAYLVSMSNFSILHVGDTDLDLTREPMKTLDIKNKELDIAVLPYWLLLENNAVEKINNLMSPKHIIATHIPPDFSLREQRQLLNKFSNVTLLTKLGEVHYYKK